MLINKIQLHNYRLYRGTNQIVFSFLPKRNVFLIFGENGFGKTTFLHSLLWCLYGRLASDIEESLKKEISNGGYSTLLQNNLNNSQRALLSDVSADTISKIKRYGYTLENDYVKSYSQYYVEIDFSEVIIPSIPCSSLSVKRSYDVILDKEWVDIFIDGKSNELTNEIGPEIFINDFILNKDIARFFFFDSEQIVSLAETNSSSDRKRLSSAYNEVLGVRKYEDLRNSLNNIRVRFRRRSNDVVTRQKIDYSINKRDFIDKELLDLQESIESIDSDIRRLKVSNEELQLQLLREGNSATTEEIAKLKLIQETCTKKDLEYKTLLKSFLEYAPLALMGNLFARTKHQVDADHRSTSLISRVEERNNLLSDFTSDLLLMTRHLNIDNATMVDIQEGLQTVLNKYKSESLGHEVLLDISEADYKEFCSIYNYITSTYRSEFERLTDDYKKNRQILDRTTRKLSNIDSKEKDALISSIRSEKDKIEKEIITKENELRNLYSRIGEKKQSFATIQKQIYELLKNIDLDDLDSKKDALASSLCDELSSFLKLLKEEKKVSLERRIKSILNCLMHKGDFIGKVKVNINNDDMDIELYTPLGTLKNKDSLSKGEQQLYASSLLKALVEESGIKFPVFIDSPLQKFDKSHASKIITDFYPSISSQVILFPLLYKELTIDELNLIKPLINECFMIENDVNSSHFEPVSIDALIDSSHVYTN